MERFEHRGVILDVFDVEVFGSWCVGNILETEESWQAN